MTNFAGNESVTELVRKIEQGTSTFLAWSVYFLEKEKRFLSELGPEKRKSYDDVQNKEKNHDHEKPTVCLEDDRVILDDELPGDYIHANYISGFEEQDLYIATQVPDHHSVVDFWRMVWHTNPAFIVSLANLKDTSASACWFYWPLRPTEMYRFGHIMVENLGYKEEKEWIETRLKIVLCNSGEWRKITHLMYTEWDEHRAPKSIQSLRHFHKRMEEEKEKEKSPGRPIIVQCTTGAERSGALILLDISMKALHKSKRLDAVNDFMGIICQKRPGAAGTYNQFISVWFALLLEALDKKIYPSVGELPPFKNPTFPPQLPLLPPLPPPSIPFPTPTTDRTQQTQQTTPNQPEKKK